MKRHKTNKSLTLAMAFVLGCLTSLPAHAEEAPTRAEMAFDLEGITVEAARPDWESKLSPGSVTVIRPDDYKGEQKTLPDLMRKVPGVHVREVNGKGQYTTVTVRGSTAAQVGVFIDGVLSNLGGDSAVDLSTIPVANVERIEVYRGYIPARFAGTFIGGVINIVTKKPTKTDVSVELGKSSFGGKKGATEITAPLGDGSLMFGLNYESSDGDFTYENYAAKSAIPGLLTSIAGAKAEIENFNSTQMNLYEGKIDLAGVDATNWKDFLEAENDGFVDKYTNYLATSSGIPKEVTLGSMMQAGYNEAKSEEYMNTWTSTIDQSVKQEICEKIAAQTAIGLNPDSNETLKKLGDTQAENKRQLAAAQNAKRWRDYNDYENINSILKWQNENWMVKAAWNKIDRHLPDGLWGGSPVNAVDSYMVDIEDRYFYDSRRQKIDTKELMVQNRNNVGKLEWGWLLDYTNSDKEYRAEHIMKNETTDYDANTQFGRAWSRYESDKYNAQIDGTYKLSDNNMLDFQVNFSHEKMDVNGSGLEKGSLTDTTANSTLGTIRNRYEQDLLNIQIQDTITLDDKDSWFLTPSVKYNRSTITGYSDSERFAEASENKFKWIHPEDEQTDDKVTWQLALKKEFDDSFTMRMTGGTYYRLLNMYEIAGDGAGILPAPNDERVNESVFPMPEEGKQFDISAIWNGSALGADNRTTLTYFWRDSENMLQLQRVGKDYWCYLNDAKGTSRGVELQTSFNWDKFDLDLQATYIDSESEVRNSSGIGYDYLDAWATYQPEWEGNARLTYRPHHDVSIFAEAHYTDMYYTNRTKDTTSSEAAYLSGRPVDDLLVFNTGIKMKLKNKWLVTIGCNDVFDKGPEQTIYVGQPYGSPLYINPEFPVQGRTYYATVKCEF